MDMLFFLQDAGGGAAPAGGQPAGPGLGGMMIPLVLMFVVMYFLMIRPQNKERKKREETIAALKKNDHVLTSAGIYGIVKQLSDQDITLCVDERKDVCIRVSRASIASVVKVSGAPAEADAKTEATEKKS